MRGLKLGSKLGEFTGGLRLIDDGDNEYVMKLRVAFDGGGCDYGVVCERERVLYG